MGLVSLDMLMYNDRGSFWIVIDENSCFHYLAFVDFSVYCKVMSDIRIRILFLCHGIRF